MASLLESWVPAVSSALQRARATLADRAPAETDPCDPLDDQLQRLLDRYLDAFERYDMDAMRELMHEAATQSMPPFDLWLTGRDEVIAWMVDPGHGARARG